MSEEVSCLGSGLEASEETTPTEDEVRSQAGPVEGVDDVATIEAFAGDYGPARWLGAPNHSFMAANRPHDLTITYIIIHYTAGMSFPVAYGPGGLAHYEVGQNGGVNQRLGEAFIAYHAGNWFVNQHSIGIEHQGFGRPGDWTNALYETSARLTAHLCRKYGIPADRQHIFGHSEVRGATHTDVGPNFDWGRYMRLVRGFLGGNSPGVVYRVQAGRFDRRENAEQLVRRLKAKGFDAFIDSD